MGPIGRCCLWYCSGIMFVGVIFFAILIAMEAAGSEYLKPHSIENFDYPKDSIMSLLIAIAVSHFLSQPAQPNRRISLLLRNLQGQKELENDQVSLQS